MTGHRGRRLAELADGLRHIAAVESLAAQSGPYLADDTWRDDALCKGRGGLFFSDDGTDIRDALALCRACPVARPCHAYAVAHGVTDGIWGAVRRDRWKHRPIEGAA